MANNQLFDSLQLRGFLSFGPGSEPVKLTGLNVLIGPNGVGKSNFIEAVELLRATPTDFAGAVRIGGLPSDWIWHGEPGSSGARIEAVLTKAKEYPRLRYGIEFTDSRERLEIVDEVLENLEKDSPQANTDFFYRSRNGHHAIIMVKNIEGQYKKRVIEKDTIDLQQSIFSQRKDHENYPEITAIGIRFKNIQTHREWSSGRTAALRRPQSANLPTDILLPQNGNLWPVLNGLELRPEWERFNELMSRFFPRYKRLSTNVNSGAVQVYLHEDDLSAPIPATRLSDGTLRFLGLLAILLNSESAPLICVEEPELGLHPDAMPIIAELLVEASTKTQLIVTTHSEALVSELTEHAESVLVCEYGREGTELHRLESEKLQFWLEEYRLGDIWRIGKIGGNP